LVGSRKGGRYKNLHPPITKKKRVVNSKTFKRKLAHLYLTGSRMGGKYKNLHPPITK
jgi:dsDNA-specific endonuclease/ATPase MutS2